MENQEKNSDLQKILRTEFNRALLIILAIALFISLIDNWSDVQRGFEDGRKGVYNPENTKH